MHACRTRVPSGHADRARVGAARDTSESHGGETGKIPVYSLSVHLSRSLGKFPGRAPGFLKNDGKFEGSLDVPPRHTDTGPNPGETMATRRVAATEEGIRSYGHGKFHNIIDSYIYALTLDGGADREESFDEGGGWYGFVTLDPKDAERVRKAALADHDELTDDEEELLAGSVAVILFERSDGIVEAEWFSDEKEADEEWAAIEEQFEEEPEEEEEEDE